MQQLSRASEGCIASCRIICWRSSLGKQEFVLLLLSKPKQLQWKNSDLRQQYFVCKSTLERKIEQHCQCHLPFEIKLTSPCPIPALAHSSPIYVPDISVPTGVLASAVASKWAPDFLQEQQGFVMLQSALTCFYNTVQRARQARMCIRSRL